MQKDYRTLPDDVLEHPIILRLHLLASRMIGWHNDIVSLPKELSRQGDVINLVITLRDTHEVAIEDAYQMALNVHDERRDDRSDDDDRGRLHGSRGDHPVSRPAPSRPRRDHP
jgi:hypothetical protein